MGSAARIGLPIPAISAALNYYDGYRSERLPHNLLQAQRDYFGAHTYERLDRGERFILSGFRCDENQKIRLFKDFSQVDEIAAIKTKGFEK